MTTKLTAASDMSAIVAHHNYLTGKNADGKNLAKRGKAKLLEQIAALEAAEEARLKAIADAEAAAKKAATVKPPKEKKAPKEKKEKGPVIRQVAEAMLLEVVSRDADGRPYGHSYETILTNIKAQFDGAKTSVACLRWYAVHMRERGEKVPNRPRAQPAVKKAD